MKVIAENRRAFHDYEILDALEAGLVLTGREIKAVRAGKVQLAGSYVKLLGDGLFWVGGIVQSGNDEQRSRKLLVHRRELESLRGKVQQKGLALVPIKIYLAKSYAKISVAVARGKKLHDKREAIKQKELNRRLR